MPPQNQNDYWELVENNKDTISNLIRQFHPAYANKHSHQITAPNAEEMLIPIRSAIEGQMIEPLVRFNRLLEERNKEIIDLFNEVWFGMPESMESRAVEGFGLLCTLCEEGDVLYEEN